jgi:hypothetical protein
MADIFLFIFRNIPEKVAVLTDKFFYLRIVHHGLNLFKNSKNLVILKKKSAMGYMGFGMQRWIYSMKPRKFHKY